MMLRAARSDKRLRLVKKLAAPVVGLVVAFAMPMALQAMPITYNLRVTGISGPLTGVTENGSFTYDSSSIVPNGMNDSTNLLTALNLTWNGIAYDQISGNTGRLAFNSTGDLTLAIFGNNCSAGACAILPMTNDWYAEVFIGETVVGSFAYSTPSSPNIAAGTVTAELMTPGNAVAEPSTLAVIAASLTSLVLFKFLRESPNEKTCLSGRRAGSSVAAAPSAASP